MRWSEHIRRFSGREDGATLIEYAMLVFLVAMLCLLAVKAVGSKISNVYNQANTLIP